MTFEPLHLLVIAGMAAVTYLSRLGGYLLLAGFEPGPRLARVLSEIPGATFAALLAPMPFQGGPVEWSGAALTALVLARTGQVLPALLSGAVAVAAIRFWVG